jgi:hypothetical protein
MHIISNANVVYFIAYVYKKCIDCSSKWTVDTDNTPWSVCHGASKGVGKFSGFPVIRCDIFLKF